MPKHAPEKCIQFDAGSPQTIHTAAHTLPMVEQGEAGGARSMFSQKEGNITELDYE